MKIVPILQAINYLRLSSRVDAVASRVQTAVSMQRVTKDMTSVVRGMESALKQMNLEQIATMLDRFEKGMENIDVQTDVIEQTVGGVTAQSIPEGDVQVIKIYFKKNCIMSLFRISCKKLPMRPA